MVFSGLSSRPKRRRILPSLNRGTEGQSSLLQFHGEQTIPNTCHPEERFPRRRISPSAASNTSEHENRISLFYFPFSNLCFTLYSGNPSFFINSLDLASPRSGSMTGNRTANSTSLSPFAYAFSMYCNAPPRSPCAAQATAMAAAVSASSGLKFRQIPCDIALRICTC